MDGPLSPDARARELLRRVLPEQEWKRFSTTGVLEVSGPRRTYLISANELTRAVDSRTGRPLGSACMQLGIAAPVHDRIIAEYLLIRNDEDLYWRSANIFPASSDTRAGLAAVAVLDLILLGFLLMRLGG